MPSGIASISATLLVLQAILAASARRRIATVNGGSESSAANHELNAGDPEYVDQRGDAIIFAFRCTRLLCCLSLLILFIYTTIGLSGIAFWFNIGLCVTFVSWSAGGPATLSVLTNNAKAYVTILSLLSVIAPPSTSALVRKHLATVLVATWIVYVHRDIWPYATWTLSPADESEGWILWVKIILLSIAAIVIPAVSPRKYEPFDPKVCVSNTPCLPFVC